MWLLGISFTLAHAQSTLHLRVVDGVGEPLPTALVRCADEGDMQHAVNPQTAAWSIQQLHTRGGHEIPLRRGMSVQAYVWAPGYWGQNLEFEVGRSSHTVVLEPLEPTPDPLGARTLDAVYRWQAHAEGPRPSDDQAHRAWVERSSDLQMEVWCEAWVWLSQSDWNEAAMDLYKQTSSHPLWCGRNVFNTAPPLNPRVGGEGPPG